MRVRPVHRGDSAIEIPTECVLLRSSFRVHVDKDYRSEAVVLAEQTIHAAEGIIHLVHKHSPLDIENYRACARSAFPPQPSSPRRALRIICRTQQMIMG